ncbi:plant self-incompatibility S1 [Artemisia annua]|uniref:S-protein homolog n=1 Tax=Artemisia annua TaxID=35608 RepID=A0A2U1QG03_ARTAN|nr:plant self-incompatibility S1 [Artemisia annua]
MRNVLVFLFFALATCQIPCTVVSSSVDPNCFLVFRFHMYIINSIPEDIVVHVNSKDDDLGNRTLPLGGSRDWSFCAPGWTRFRGEFWWGSKYISFNVFDDYVDDNCDEKAVLRTRHCYWLIRHDGFYIGPKNETWPNWGNWDLVWTWPSSM